MEDSYDVIVLGTGLKECILSGLLSVDGMKVLHLDRNGYYGGASASLQLNQLYETYKKGETPKDLGASRDYNVDVVPKLIMSMGKLVKALLHTDVTRYLEFKSVGGSYVFRQGKIYKVPSDDTEALKSSLMSLFEKRRCQKFFIYAQDYKVDDPKTHQGYDLTKMTMAELYAKFGLQPDTIDFIGHAVCLYLNDDYLTQPAQESILRMQLYFNSLARYSKSKSPYLYPLYGLGELPQGFARLSAIYGGTYMLNAPIDHVVIEDGKAVGVQSSEGDKPIAKCKFIVADPSYFPDRVHSTGKVVRAICLLSHPVPNTDNAESAQIIIPQKQVGRRSDIYVSIVSYANNVAPKGRWIATCSATIEHPEGDPVKELAPALALLGTIDEQFVSVCDLMEPNEDGRDSKIFISKSYDATSHFETTVDDVIDMYRRITGKELDLSPKERKEEETA